MEQQDTEYSDINPLSGCISLRDIDISLEILLSNEDNKSANLTYDTVNIAPIMFEDSEHNKHIVRSVKVLTDVYCQPVNLLKEDCLNECTESTEFNIK